MKIILASGSPRRRELLTRMGLDFDILTAEVSEELPSDMHPREGVGVLALRKARAVAARVGADVPVLAADTLVEIGGRPLGKPGTRENACRMLRTLSGQTHRVHTGAALLWKGKEYLDTDTTAVTFRSLSEEQIAAYVRTGEPMDKAGAYGIQGQGGALVDHIEGDFETVVGLSRAAVEKLLADAGIG